MKYLLVVIWLIGNQPTIMTDGWSPLPFDTIEECEERKDFLLDHLEEHAEDNLTLYSVTCGTQQEIQDMIDREILSIDA